MYAPDEELVSRARAGDDRAIAALLERYRAVVRAKARIYFLPGGDSDDVIQEGMIGLYKAVRRFDPQRGAPFSAFVELLVRRQILTAIGSAGRRGNAPLNTSTSLAPGHVEAHDRARASSSVPSGDPVDVVLDREAQEGFAHFMRTALTDLEREVLARHLIGQSYDAIAQEVGRSPKAVDNALQRVRRKVTTSYLSREEGERSP